MKRLIIALALLASLSAEKASAQVWINDSVNCTGSIKKDVWYSLRNGTVATDTFNNWIMALSQMPQTGGVWVNHNAGVRLFNTHKPISQLASITYADTLASDLQYNTDYTWERGAMNVNRNPTDTFDYGWGTYDQVSHNVYGDSVYIINQGNSYYAIAIDSLVGSTWTYHTRVLAMGLPFGPQPFNFAQGTTYANKNFQYISASMSGLSALNREPENSTWDIMFGKYISMISLGGPPVPYPVAGALTNYKTQVARVQGVAIDDAYTNAQTYARNTRINNIGSDWKVWNGTAYIYPDSLTYIVQAKDNMLWQLKFTEYNSATGDMKFMKREVGFPTAVSDVKSGLNSMLISPNPTNGNAVVVLDAKRSSKATMRVLSQTGAIIAQRSVDVEQGMNAYSLDFTNLAQGIYFVSVSGADINVSSRVVKQ
jgi:hypothetical protein